MTNKKQNEKKISDLVDENKPQSWDRRQFLVFSSRLGLLTYLYGIHDAIANPTHNIAFWRQSTSITPLWVSEIHAAVAAISTAGGLNVSEIYAAVAAISSTGGLNVSEIHAEVAATTTPSVQVSEVFVAVVAK